MNSRGPECGQVFIIKEWNKIDYEYWIFLYKIRKY
jgi:hypothetical protein